MNLPETNCSANDDFPTCLSPIIAIFRCKTYEDELGRDEC